MEIHRNITYSAAAATPTTTKRICASESAPNYTPPTTATTTMPPVRDISKLSYTRTRTHHGAKMCVKVTSDTECVYVTVTEGQDEIGHIHGIHCRGDTWSKKNTADSLDAVGYDTIHELLSLDESIHHPPLLYLGTITAEGKGRQIALLMLQELGNAIKLCAYDDRPLICWFVHPLHHIKKNTRNTLRLIRYYRRIGAINPCPNRNIALWDPCNLEDDYDLYIFDAGDTRHPACNQV